MMANKAGELPGPPGRSSCSAHVALGNFRDLLIEVAKDPAMLVWLDGRPNTRQRPQENFGREIMELFTLGVGNYTEQDVYAAARVFTGWNIRLVRRRDDTTRRVLRVRLQRGQARARRRRRSRSRSTANGSRTIPARAAADGMQDGIDFIAALARHPETARRLARKLWNFFVSDLAAAGSGRSSTASRRRISRTTPSMRSVVRLHPAVAAVPESPSTRTRDIRGRRSSSSARSRKSAGTAFRSTARARR